jgi:outer membrane protein assembly factor BamB
MKTALITLLALVVTGLCLQADDWPGFRGPLRDGKSAEKGLLASWPKEGPALVWKITDAGDALSGMAIAGGRLYTMGQYEDGQYTLCYDLGDGKQLWKTRNGATFTNSFGDGPRCTPTLDGDMLFALGAQGDLQCLQAANGSEKWKLNILEEFGGQNIGWGISESPLVDGDRVIVTPGGTGGTMVALYKSSGRPVWQSRDPNANGAEQAGYASPLLITLGDQRQIVTFTSKGAYGANARDGKFLWRYDQVANSTANCSSPVYHNGKILYSSDYGTGCALLELKPDGTASEVYFNKNLKSHHGGYVLVDGHVYGFDSSNLVCLEWETGKVKWKDRSVGKGSVTYADGKLYVLSENGVMGLVNASHAAYSEISRFKLPDLSGRSTWVYPVISNGRLYLRDQQIILCYDIKAK